MYTERHIRNSGCREPRFLSFSGYYLEELKRDAALQHREKDSRLIDLLIRQVVVFRDKICITFNYSHNDKKGKRRNYEINVSELEEAQAKHREGEESSNLFTLAPPKVNNPNTIIFVKAEYWGVWIANKIR